MHNNFVKVEILTSFQNVIENVAYARDKDIIGNTKRANTVTFNVSKYKFVEMGILGAMQNTNKHNSPKQPFVRTIA